MRRDVARVAQRPCRTQPVAFRIIRSPVNRGQNSPDIGHVPVVSGQLSVCPLSVVSGPLLMVNWPLLFVGRQNCYATIDNEQLIISDRPQAIHLPPTDH